MNSQKRIGYLSYPTLPYLVVSCLFSSLRFSRASLRVFLLPSSSFFTRTQTSFHQKGMPFILTRLYQHNPSTGPSPPAHFRWESKINMATVDSMSLTSGDNRQCTGATFLARSSSRYNTASYNGKYGNPVTNLSQHLPLTTAVEYANDALH